MKKYNHLTEANRSVIEVLHQENYTVTEIARKIGCNKSTISREIRSRSERSEYNSFSAQCNYETNRERCKMKKKLHSIDLRNYVVERIESGWSPACIVGRMALENKPFSLCAETIYNFVYTDSYCIERKLYQYLRRGKRRRTKLNNRKTKSEKILNKVSIEKRPEQINNRSEFGHWEGDSIVSKGKKSFLNTLVERLSRFTIATKLGDHTSQLTKIAITAAFGNLYEKSVTVDNGTEFSKHEDYGVDVYFCHPYSSWEKGTNENTNGLIRRYLPKTKKFDTVTQEDLNDIIWELNNRPRKVLGYKTPQEVYNLNLLICCTSP